MDDDLKLLAFPELTLAVGEWSKRNFGDKQDPYIGMVEELGELSRCVLKRFQGIRGYDSPVFFRTNYVDALGDICIYTANFAFNNSIVTTWPDIRGKVGYVSYRKILANSLFWLARLGEVPEVEVDTEKWLYNFLTMLSWLAFEEGLVLKEVANETWLTVSVRDWKVNKEDGDVKNS
jgi:hypothetical protein